jgi:protein phosphatase
MRTVSAGLTDVGKKRQNNEDSLYLDDALGLYVVADGVGGHAKGEVASAEAVEQIAMWVRRHLARIDAVIAGGARATLELTDVRRLLESGVQSACYMVYGIAQQDPEMKGMSTTMSVLLIRGGMAFVAQVGDSRVYRLRGGQLTQLTEDHTLINYKLKQGLITAEEAKHAQGKNVITRAVGHRDYVQVDVMHADVAVGDRFFLCTDGFHGYVDEDDEVVSVIQADPIGRAVAAAINLANSRGGKDNITAVLVHVRA